MTAKEPDKQYNRIEYKINRENVFVFLGVFISFLSKFLTRVYNIICYWHCLYHDHNKKAFFIVCLKNNLQKAVMFEQ